MQEALRIEVDVRDRGEERFQDVPIGPIVHPPQAARLMGQIAAALGLMHDDVLQRGHLGLLPADAQIVTPLALGRLLALIAKHVHGLRPPVKC